MEFVICGMTQKKIELDKCKKCKQFEEIQENKKGKFVWCKININK